MHRCDQRDRLGGGVGGVTPTGGFELPRGGGWVVGTEGRAAWVYCMKKGLGLGAWARGGTDAPAILFVELSLCL